MENNCSVPFMSDLVHAFSASQQMEIPDDKLVKHPKDVCTSRAAQAKAAVSPTQGMTAATTLPTVARA